mgnify:CR=1 FL=1
MALLHSIAGYEFREIVGSFVARTQQLEVIARQGRDDAIVRLNHIRGPVFTVQTVEYVSDFNGAIVAIDTYSQLKDGRPYTVFQYGQDMGDYWVLDVREVSRQKVSSVIGGPAGGETVKQVCQWSLMHVNPAPPANN